MTTRLFTKPVKASLHKVKKWYKAKSHVSGSPSSNHLHFNASMYMGICKFEPLRFVLSMKVWFC